MTSLESDKILLAVTGWDPEVWQTEFAKISAQAQARA